LSHLGEDRSRVYRVQHLTLGDFTPFVEEDTGYDPIDPCPHIGIDRSYRSSHKLLRDRDIVLLNRYHPDR
jgi:hypothetical protein